MNKLNNIKVVELADILGISKQLASKYKKDEYLPKKHFDALNEYLIDKIKNNENELNKIQSIAAVWFKHVNAEPSFDEFKSILDKLIDFYVVDDIDIDLLIEALISQNKKVFPQVLSDALTDINYYRLIKNLK